MQYWCIHNAYSNLSSNHCCSVHLQLIMKFTHMKRWKKIRRFHSRHQKYWVHTPFTMEQRVYMTFFSWKLCFRMSEAFFCDVTGQCLVFTFFFFFVTVNMKFWNFIHFKTFSCLFFLLFACTNRLYNLIRSLIDPGKNIEIPGLIFPVATLVTSVLIGCI